MAFDPARVLSLTLLGSPSLTLMSPKPCCQSSYDSCFGQIQTTVYTYRLFHKVHHHNATSLRFWKQSGSFILPPHPCLPFVCIYVADTLDTRDTEDTRLFLRVWSQCNKRYVRQSTQYLNRQKVVKEPAIMLLSFPARSLNFALGVI